MQKARVLLAAFLFLLLTGLPGRCQSGSCTMPVSHGVVPCECDGRIAGQMSIAYCSQYFSAAGCHMCTLCGWNCCGNWVCTACPGGCYLAFLFDAKTGAFVAKKECGPEGPEAVSPSAGEKKKTGQTGTSG